MQHPATRATPPASVSLEDVLKASGDVAHSSPEQVILYKLPPILHEKPKDTAPIRSLQQDRNEDTTENPEHGPLSLNLMGCLIPS